MSEDNMELWNKVCSPDPKYVKKARQSWGTIDTTDAQYQVKVLTELYGPVGQGWGYAASDMLVIPAPTEACPGQQVLTCGVTLWLGDRENCWGPVYGTAMLYNHKGVPDDEAPKKALTNAVSKGLSHAGFSADIYLKKWDGDKYDDGKAPKKAAKKAPKPKATILDKIEGITDPKMLPKVAQWMAEKMPRNTAEQQAQYDEAKAAFKKRSLALRASAEKDRVKEDE